MAEQPINTMFYTALWRQFGAAVDMLENALLACPDALWSERLWSGPPPEGFPPQFAEFWYVTFHTLIFFDLYLSGVPEEDFTPPAPFAQGDIDSVDALPERPYSKEELHAYLTKTRQKCRTRLLQLSDEQARQVISYPWMKERSMSYLEWQLLTLRHVQEHTAQLSLFLGQHGISGEALDWVPWAKEEAAS
ncbi:hypothetical protein KDH_69210 [Dictyobacter sp. S3.2.2.5]|uniref:DinB-like domain-containing protein n=1 Tax=Dictyobacter halimunensis TaxID=3026934 RepID=A0ABQ6G4D0_9CHLR|nr:hypothetical protein KDH_69210 [Dictyobacter sp. S3.2.2.5]